MGMGIFANPNTPLDADAVSSICDIHGYTFAREKREKGGGVKAQQEPVKEPEPVPVVEEPKATLITRTPIITVMGHVDHGKTSLLDYIRKTRVAKGEAGGITQHIGAYTVDYNGSTLTFLDTPGHAIFTEMRARGADVTDIVVLVVAANDGIMPQTREAIAHSKAAGKTIIVAINKCDLPAADPVKTKSGLMEEGLVPTDFGGDVECVEVSALTGAGIDDLLGLLVLQSEVLELQANPKANCRASIIEARVEPGTGSSATAIVESGTIRVGMPFICGPYAGKVRALVNDHGERVKKVGPGMPVEITGFSETPNVGDELVERENERAAKSLGEERQEELRKQRLAQPRKARMEELLAMMGDGTQKAQLKILLKGDVQGSVEAIRKAVLDIQSDKVECVFLNASAGPISESDVLLASSSDAVILGFNVKVEANAVKLLKREGVQVKLYSIVYELIDQVRDAMLGLLEPETRETIIGHAKVLQVFKLNKGPCGRLHGGGRENPPAAARRASSATRRPSLTVKCPPSAASRMKWKKSRQVWNAASASETSTNTKRATSSNATRWKKSSKRCNPQQKSSNRDGAPCTLLRASRKPPSLSFLIPPSPIEPIGPFITLSLHMSRRTDKVNELLRREIGTTIQRDFGISRNNRHRD